MIIFTWYIPGFCSAVGILQDIITPQASTNYSVPSVVIALLGVVILKLTDPAPQSVVHKNVRGTALPIFRVIDVLLPLTDRDDPLLILFA